MTQVELPERVEIPSTQLKGATTGGDAHRFRGLARRGTRFVSRMPDGSWGVAANTMESLRKRLRDVDFAGIYELRAHFFDDVRQIPDIELILIEEGLLDEECVVTVTRNTVHHLENAAELLESLAPGRDPNIGLAADAVKEVLAGAAPRRREIEGGSCGL